MWLANVGMRDDCKQRPDMATVAVLRAHGATVEREGNGRGPYVNKTSDVLSQHLHSGRISQAQFDAGQRFANLWFHANGTGFVSQLHMAIRGPKGVTAPESVVDAKDQLNRLLSWQGFSKKDVAILRSVCGVGQSVGDFMHTLFPKKSKSWIFKKGMERLRNALDKLGKYWGA